MKNDAWGFHVSGSVFGERFPMGSLDLSLGFFSGSNSSKVGDDGMGPLLLLN